MARDDTVVRVDTVDGETVVAFVGELDVTGAEHLRATLERLDHPPADGEAVPRVIVDLAECSFMDSAGLSVLIGSHKRLAAAGAELVLRAPNDRVYRVMDITRMTSVLKIER